MMLRAGRRSVAAVVLLLAPSLTAAQGRQPIAPSLSLQLDNDFFALRGSGPPPDYDYTHGTRIEVAWPRAPQWLGHTLGADPRCGALPIPRPCMLSAIAVAQEIYTPRHNSLAPTPGDRPAAAWLFGELRLERLAGPHLQAVALRFGTTGPPALGEQVQNGIHRMLRNELEETWSHQLPAQLVMTAEYLGTRVLLADSAATISRFLAGSVSATMGTVRRALSVGMSAYWGFGPGGEPSADAPLVRRPGKLFVEGGYQQSLVLYDEFIEGRGATTGAERRPWVGEGFAALGSRIGRFSLEYRFTSRGREYESEPGRHSYGSIVVGVLFP